MKYVNTYLQDGECWSFKKSPIHFLKEPVRDLLNNALNIIRDFYLERYSIFSDNAIKHMHMLNMEKIKFVGEYNLTHNQWEMANKFLRFLHAFMSSNMQ